MTNNNIPEDYLSVTQLLLNALPLCASCWNKELKIIACNDHVIDLFGLECKEDYMTYFFDLSPKYQPNGKLSSEQVLIYITKTFEEGYQCFEWQHRKLNGEPVHCEVSLIRSVHKDQEIVLCYIIDLNAKREFQAKINEAEKRTQIMLDAMPLSCNLWDINHNLIDCNHEAVKLFSLRNKQEYLERFSELSPSCQLCGKSSTELAFEKLEQAFREGYCRYEWLHQRLDGELIPTEITLVRVNNGDEEIVASYTRDLRELKAMLNEMHKVEIDLRNARDAAEESTKAKSEFLANMSHEIRTPMNGILGLVHLIQKTELTPKQRDYVDKTFISAKNLLRILNDILDFSKIEAGKLDMEQIEFSLKDIFKEIHSIFRSKIKSRMLSFKLDLPANIPPTILGDPLRIKQVLINLIGNAIKFTPSGSIVVRVKKEAEDQHNLWLNFSIKDTGIGMTEDQINAIFRPFTQADNSITRKYGGTGLGLVISQSLVTMMQGTLSVESQVGAGSEFKFSTLFSKVLPKDLTLPKEDTVPEVSCEENCHLNQARILVVEDNEINQIIAEELLKSQGYIVEIANNGQEAINMVQNGHYALVLMDIQMPIVDGITATKLIREEAKYDHLPIIAMSAHAMVGDMEKSLRNGMNDYLTKPIDPEQLYNTLKKWIYTRPEILSTN